MLLESIKAHLESLSPQQRYDVDSKAEALHKHWIELKDLVLKRVDCVSLLIEFFEKANELASQLDNLDKQLKQTADEQKLQFLQENWKHIRADYADLKSLGTRFINLKVCTSVSYIIYKTKYLWRGILESNSGDSSAFSYI